MATRYETMTKEDIVGFVKKCSSADCSECPAFKYYIDNETDDCCMAYLEEEIVQIPRWQTAKTQDDMNTLIDGYRSHCHSRAGCEDCKYDQTLTGSKLAGTFGCFVSYLTELVEAPYEGNE